MRKERIRAAPVRLVRASAAFWIAACAVGETFAATAQERAPPFRDGVADALAGHGAEMRQFGAQADPLRRAVFFDPVDVESAPAGVPCDHVARRRPEAVAGAGRVALMRSENSGKTLRYWEPPPTGGEDGFEARARDFAARSGFHENVTVIAARAFAWCR